jgi:hypothetical protein
MSATVGLVLGVLIGVCVSAYLYGFVGELVRHRRHRCPVLECRCGVLNIGIVPPPDHCPACGREWGRLV